MSASEMTGRSTLLDTYRFWGEAFRVWLRIAALSFGGPAGQIAVMDLHNRNSLTNSRDDIAREPWSFA